MDGSRPSITHYLNLVNTCERENIMASQNTHRLPYLRNWARLGIGLIALGNAVPALAQATTPAGVPASGTSDPAPADAPNGATAVPAWVAVRAYASGSTSLSGDTLSATADDTSLLWASEGAVVAADGLTLTASGNSSSGDASSFYGLNAPVLATSGAKITLQNSTIKASGTGANGIFAYGDGSSVTVSDTAIDVTADLAHGIMSSGGGTVTATNLLVSTAGKHSAAIATDRGGGTIVSIGGTYITSGEGSPGLYSTGNLQSNNEKFTLTGSEAVVVEGSNSATVRGSTFTAANGGVMLYQSFSGDAEGSEATFTMMGGAITAAAGPMFYVTNATGEFNLSGVALSAASGDLVKASIDRWGAEGSNGGHAIVNASAQMFEGNLTADSISSILLNLTNGSSWTGAATNASVSLDAASVWKVTADTSLDALTDAAGITGNTIANITGAATVTYDATDTANAWLGGNSFSLEGGGTLQPRS
jgi:hypothetical protein